MTIDERSTNSDHVGHVNVPPRHKATRLLVRLRETHERNAERRTDNQQSLVAHELTTKREA